MRFLSRGMSSSGRSGRSGAPDDLAGAACGFDEGVAQAFERAAGGVGEGQSHAPIMSRRLCHSSVRHRYQLATVR